jgi:hypothetical protein
MAPTVVVISISMPRRTFDKPFLTYLLADPVDVATIPTRLAAAAVVASCPKMMVRTGTKMIPPPNPKSAPTIPAPTEMSRSTKSIIGSIFAV